jgi:hypothetical protein
LEKMCGTSHFSNADIAHLHELSVQKWQPPLAPNTNLQFSFTSLVLLGVTIKKVVTKLMWLLATFFAVFFSYASMQLRRPATQYNYIISFVQCRSRRTLCLDCSSCMNLPWAV